MDVQQVWLCRRGVDRTVEAIRRRKASILQPTTGGAARTGYPVGETETLRNEVSSGRYAYMSIDAAAAVLLGLEDAAAKNSMTVWSFIEHAQKTGTLTPTEARVVRLRIASWNSRGVPLSAEDICLAALGEAAEGRRDDRSPAARAARALMTDVPTAQVLGHSAEVIAKLMRDESHSRSAASWFLRLLYMEALVARTVDFPGTADDLTARLAALCVKEVYDSNGADVIVRTTWSVLDEVRIAWGGTPDRDAFFRHVGEMAAALLQPVAKKHGIAAMGAEESFRMLLFSLATPGTQDRQALENAYFARTTELLKQK